MFAKLKDFDAENYLKGVLFTINNNLNCWMPESSLK
jgi:hypothetical protein